MLNSTSLQLYEMVSRLGLEPRTLALKAQPNLKEINRLIL